MSESFSEPAARDTDGDTAEPDVETNDDQVEPANGSEYVGRVAGVKIGSGSSEPSSSPAGRETPQTAPVAR